MDQANSKYRPELQLQPGRYRIVSEIAGTIIQVSEHDYNNVVTWESYEGENQQWFVQNSGDGYKFKNCQRGNYLAVPNSDQGTRIYASQFPTTWVLLKLGDCHLIQHPGNDRGLDLHWGWKTNGNQMHLFPISDNQNIKYKTWRFVRIGDDTGEELPENFRKEIDHLKYDLAEMGKNVAQKDRMLAQQSELVSRQETTIRRLEQDLKSKLEELVQVRQGNEETLQLRKQQAELKDELLHQQANTGNLQGKLAKIEQFMAQMMKKDEERLANMP